MLEDRIFTLLKKLKARTIDKDEMVELLICVSSSAKYDGLYEEMVNHIDDKEVRHRAKILKMETELIIRRN